MYNLLLSIGIVAMFIVGTIIGIQFMISGAEGQAKVKEALVPYIVGCVVIFGAFTIWDIAVNIGQDATSPTLPYSVIKGVWYECIPDRDGTGRMWSNLHRRRI